MVEPLALMNILHKTMSGMWLIGVCYKTTIIRVVG